MSESETRLGRAIINAINATRLAYVWRNQSGKVQVRGAWMTLAPVGSPDIVGHMRDGTGRFVGIDVKLTDGKVSPEQIEWKKRMAEDGCVCGIATSVFEAIEIVRGY